MSMPAIFLGVVIAALIGALYHLWRGGALVRIIFFLMLALIGFFAANFLAKFNGWIIWQIGQIDVGFGVLGALLILGFGDWLTLNLQEA
jgi:hypothetical protein